MLLTRDADPNNRTNPPKRCGFYFDLLQSWKAWLENIRTLRAGKQNDEDKSINHNYFFPCVCIS
jgi:hypothetical protein